MRWPPSSSTMARTRAQQVSKTQAGVWQGRIGRSGCRRHQHRVLRTGLRRSSTAWLSRQLLLWSSSASTLAFNLALAPHPPAPAPADGMCQEKCPVKINTGELVKQLRSEEMAEGHPRASAVAMVRCVHYAVLGVG